MDYKITYKSKNTQLVKNVIKCEETEDFLLFYKDKRGGEFFDVHDVEKVEEYIRPVAHPKQITFNEKMDQ